MDELISTQLQAIISRSKWQLQWSIMLMVVWVLAGYRGYDSIVITCSYIHDYALGRFCICNTTYLIIS